MIIEYILPQTFETMEEATQVLETSGPPLRWFIDDDIGNNFIEAVVYFIQLLSFLIVFLPIKILILLWKKEPINLLRKNFLIEFKDNTACIINIYNESDYNKILHVLEENKIKIDSSFQIAIVLK